METLSILVATRYALLKHQDQRRKIAHSDQFVPYVVHPIEVATILVECGIKNSTVLQAAILHDILEDTDVSVKALGKKFGGKVASIVEELTDSFELSSVERKKEQVKRAPSLGWEASAIKIADKTSNLRDLVRFTPDWKSARFNAYVQSAGALVSAIAQHKVKILPRRLFEVFWEAHKEAMEFVSIMEVSRSSRVASGKRT